MAGDNCYEDARRAEAYSRLQFPGTYYLAYRDLPQIFARHAVGRSALDFGCGAGRSTRFLREHGFTAIGVDIAADMIAKAREIDPEGEYRLITGADFGTIDAGSIDLILSVFTFDNIPTMERKVETFRGLSSLLRAGGRIVSVVSSPEIYLHEWASFSTRDYPENRAARSGDTVRIVITDIDDPRPVEDVVWTDASYQEVYERAGLVQIERLRPLGDPAEPYEWVNETRIAPWTIYVLRPTAE